MRDSRCRCCKTTRTTWQLIKESWQCETQRHSRTVQLGRVARQTPEGVGPSRPVSRIRRRPAARVNQSVNQQPAPAVPPSPPIGPSTVHPHSVSPFSVPFHRPFLNHQSAAINRCGRPTPGERSLHRQTVWIPYFVGSFNLPSVAGRLQAAAAVAQEGPIPISVPPPALASQLSALDVSSLGLLRRRSFAVLSLGARVSVKS